MVSRWRKPGNCIFRVFLDAVPGLGDGATMSLARPGLWTVTPRFTRVSVHGHPRRRVRLRARPTDWPGRAPTARGELWMGSAGSDG